MGRSLAAVGTAGAKALCTEKHVLRIINLPILLGRMGVSVHHCFIVLGACLNACMVLLLSKHAWLLW